MLVRFLRAYGIYNAGEIAGFEDELAQKLIELKIAEEVGEVIEKAIEEPAKDKMVKGAKVKK